jgi:RNA polymerase sigma-70 factor (ECF subfamily)
VTHGGREAALEAAFAAHAASVAAVALRILGDTEAARDVAQDAFVRYSDHVAEVHGDPGPWLRTVAARLALDRLRRRRREGRALAVGALARGGGERDPDPAEAAETRERLLRALADLPERQRDVVLRRVVEGETFPALARALGIAEGSAKAHLRRALASLRRALGRDFGPDGQGDPGGQR